MEIVTILHAKIALIKLRMFGGARRVTVPFVQIAVSMNTTKIVMSFA